MVLTAPERNPRRKLLVQARRDDGATVVVVRGDVDLATAPLLRSVLAGVSVRRPARVNVDMSAAAVLDGHALAVLVVALQRIAAADASLAVTTSSAAVRRALLLTMGGEFDVVETDRPDGASTRTESPAWS